MSGEEGQTVVMWLEEPCVRSFCAHSLLFVSKDECSTWQLALIKLRSIIKWSETSFCPSLEGSPTPCSLMEEKTALCYLFNPYIVHREVYANTSRRTVSITYWLLIATRHDSNQASWGVVGHWVKEEVFAHGPARRDQLSGSDLCKSARASAAGPAQSIAYKEWVWSLCMHDVKLTLLTILSL